MDMRDPAAAIAAIRARAEKDAQDAQEAGGVKVGQMIAYLARLNRSPRQVWIAALK